MRDERLAVAVDTVRGDREVDRPQTAGRVHGDGPAGRLHADSEAGEGIPLRLQGQDRARQTGAFDSQWLAGRQRADTDPGDHLDEVRDQPVTRLPVKRASLTPADDHGAVAWTVNVGSQLPQYLDRIREIRLRICVAQNAHAVGDGRGERHLAAPEYRGPDFRRRSAA
jgi:hypothetical protein